jgi:hypothetical protein
VRAEKGEGAQMSTTPENPAAFPPAIIAAAAKIGRLCDSTAAPLNEDIAVIMLDAFMELQMTERPEPKNSTLWRYLQNAFNKQVTFHALGVNRMPDGGFHFYIHPQHVSGETEDYLIWPDPFNWEDMLVNKKDSPTPDYEAFKRYLAQQAKEPK